MTAKRNTPEGDRLDARHVGQSARAKALSAQSPDPVEAIEYHIDQKTGFSRVISLSFIGNRNCVRDLLNGRRPLTLKMIWLLHVGLGIPVESLI